MFQDERPPQEDQGTQPVAVLRTGGVLADRYELAVVPYSLRASHASASAPQSKATVICPGG